MIYTKQDVYMMQIFHHLVVNENYQMVRIMGRTQNFWLVNPSHKMYPVVAVVKYDPLQFTQDENNLKQTHRAILDAIGREGKLLLINVNENNVAFDNEYMKQVILTVSKEHESIDGFHGIANCVHDVENPQEEYAAIARQIEAFQQKKLKEFKKKRFRMRIQPITSITMVICTILFLAVNLLSSYAPSSTSAVVAMGGYYKTNVIAAHEYWRLLTSGFLHFDIFHYLMNMYALFQLGSFCEKLFKRWQYVLILIVSIIFGNLFVLIAQENVVGLGISGGLFGLLGAILMVMVENNSIKNPVVRMNMFQLLFLNLLISLMPGISMLAHLGGFVAGCFMGVMFVHSTRWHSLKKHTVAAFSMLCTVLIFLVTQIHDVYPKDIRLDTEIVDIFRDTPFDFYADYLSDCYIKMYQ